MLGTEEVGTAGGAGPWGTSEEAELEEPEELDEEEDWQAGTACS